MLKKQNITCIWRFFLHSSIAIFSYFPLDPGNYTITFFFCLVQSLELFLFLCPKKNKNSFSYLWFENFVVWTLLLTRILIGFVIARGLFYHNQQLSSWIYSIFRYEVYLYLGSLVTHWQTHSLSYFPLTSYL